MACLRKHLPNWPKKGPRNCLRRPLFRSSSYLPAGLVDVVAEDAAEHGTGDTANDCTLELVAARYGADYGTRRATNGRITLGVLYDRRATCRGRIRPGR